jgi:hypothetical protein
MDNPPFFYLTPTLAIISSKLVINQAIPEAKQASKNKAMGLVMK